MKKRNLLQRFIIIVIVTLGGLYLVIGPHRRPKFSDFTLNGIKQTLQDNIRLGLDLKGGVNLVMRVKVEEYLKTLAQNNATMALKAAQDVGAKVTNQDAGTNISGGTYSFYVKTEDGAKLNELQDEVNKKVGTRDWTPSVSGNTVTWTLTGAAARALSQEATEQAYNTIKRRINEFGVAEPTLQYHGAQGSNEILLQMPGERDPERVKQQLTGASILELVHVVSPPSPTPVQTYNSRKEGVDSLGGTVPANRDVLPYIKQWVIIERPDQNHVFNTEKEAIDSLGGTVSATRKAVPYPLWVLVQKPDQNHIFNTEKEAIGSLGGTVPANRLVLPYVEKWAVVERPDQSHTFNTEKEAADSLGGAVAGNLQILPYTGWAAVEKPDDKHTFETEKRATDSLGGTVSGNQQVLAFPDWVVIEKPSIIEGKDLSRADASQSQGGGENGYVINFNLKPDGAQKFGEWTGNNVNQYMGAVLDGKVKSIAFIKSQIFDSGQISGSFTKDSAEDLARTLRS